MKQRLLALLTCALLLATWLPIQNSSSNLVGSADGHEKNTFRLLRERMVREQISEPPDYRGPVNDKKVLKAMRTVPRHLFVRPKDTARAYSDHPLPIGYGQTISQPYIVALMTEMLEVRPEHRVLEVGTGSGYQAAILSLLVQEVGEISR